jgi:hypothetical protein
MYMKKLIALIILTLSTVVCMPASAFAAKLPASAPTAEQVGYDISWPQCGKKLPTGQSFAIIGVNGGTAANTNPCLADQLAWAGKSSGTTAQPKTQVYVNTANPGEVIAQITTWPTNNTDKTGVTTANPYGDCQGANDTACSWQYGWNRAVEDYVDRLQPTAKSASVASYVWWLDVETMNTWQSGTTDALARNTATLEGMTSYFNTHAARVGLYSTAPQWNTIVGQTVSATSNLNGLGNWRPSGASLDNAKANCKVAPLTTGGYISLTQYVQQNVDKNHSCI